jgi:hypothetical protein
MSRTFFDSKDRPPLAARLAPALRSLAERALEVRQRAFVFVNNRLEGNAPATIEAVVSDLAA